MNAHNTSSASPSAIVGLTQEHGADRRLRGPWLLIARAACLSVALLSLAIWVWGIPIRYAQLGTLCTTTVCGDQQPTPPVDRLFQAAGITLHFYSAYMGTIEVLFVAVFMLLAALIFWRKSDTVIGLLTALLLVTFGVTQTDGNALASAIPAWSVPVNLIQPLSFILFALFLYLFPDGRFAPRWTRFVASAWILLFVVSNVVFPPDVFLIVLVGFIVVSLYAQAHRYRRISTPLQRQQTKWVVLGVIISLLGSITLIVASNLFQMPQLFGAWGLLVVNTALYLLGALIPISIGVSITRFHLWDVDALINKALVYGALTAALAVTFAGLIIGLETLAGAIIGGGGQRPVALVISTLTIAALFQPLRRRIQATIDQRFYRSKYDAAHTLATFGAALRQEVELGELSEHLVAVVEETMQPARVSLWLRPARSEAPEETERLTTP